MDQMAARGIYLATTPNATFVYLATILHAIHVGAGLVALLCAAVLAIVKASWIRGELWWMSRHGIGTSWLGFGVPVQLWLR